MTFLLDRCCCCSSHHVEEERDGAAVVRSVLGNEKEEARLAASMYFDARETLTASMVFRPATRASLRLTPFDLDENPEEMLISGQLQQKKSRKKSVRETVLLRQVLKQKPPPVMRGAPDEEEVQPGYPGDLTLQELEACLELRKKIRQKRDHPADPVPEYYEIVRCYHGLEDEATALCRVLRARKFIVQDALAMLESNKTKWQEGRSHDFYPNLRDALGCPTSVLWTQLPVLQHGIAKNGSIVGYFPVGAVNLEALDCLTDLENFVAFVWNAFLPNFRKHYQKAQNMYPDLNIRAELTFVIDLKGINRSLFTDRVLNVLQECVQVLNCFPEVLSKMMIINAPFFFSAIWMIFKQLLDARTVSKIDIYSNEAKGLRCIAEHIDATESNELVSDYGGKGPTLDEVMQTQCRQDDEEGGMVRQVVERCFLHPNGHATFEFELTVNEVASIHVYTRSSAGAQFTLSQMNSAEESVEVLTTHVQSSDASAGDQKPHVRIVAEETFGPGHFVVKAESISAKRENFLVVVRVTSAN